MATPAISGIDDKGRLVVFVNGGFAHAPIAKALAANIASKDEAEAGTDNEKTMTPLRTKEAIDAQRPYASKSEAEAGAATNRVMSPLRTVEYVATLIGVDRLTGVTANTTVSVPAGWAVDNVFAANGTANPVSIKIGTTSGATDVVEAIQIDANAVIDTLQSLDFALRKRIFSKTVDQTLFIQSDSWNGASIDIAFKRTRIF